MKAEGGAIQAMSGSRSSGVPPRRLSQIFEELARSTETAITVEQLRDALGDRSFATLLVFFALINMLPLPPGSTLVLGVPLLLVSVQMVLGRSTVWLPRPILTKSVGAEQFRHMIGKVVPKIKWLERLVRPRYWPFAHGQVERAVGLCALLLATIVTLPIPLGNWFPALSCAILGLALSERDGLLLGIGVVIGLLSLAVIALLVGSAGALAAFFIF
ncbi:exopolysaccharide biosynthesis protein [Chelativorans sp. AA-79]|uniref:exopolysaccharide biosynthesis protein n=1 Tax=Chelativorans sp. AA-79 TaxID=3028735 RepID=UPI0023F721C3|nr:exopolysaccharide biosynthesis protein [Chelativorans sp. AA-79]WEX11429.1 exopolysaccharide biosynthesis protein [Chelativorans sp. AA-79]